MDRFFGDGHQDMRAELRDCFSYYEMKFIFSMNSAEAKNIAITRIFEKNNQGVRCKKAFGVTHWCPGLCNIIGLFDFSFKSLVFVAT